MTHTATADLTAIVRLWPDLRDALTTAGAAAWPPAGRMGDYLRQLAEAQREEQVEEARAERAERTPDALGERPVPLRLGILDTARAVEAALRHLADQLASDIQRPVIAMPAGDLAGWTMRDVGRRAKLARQDRADPGRWHYGAGHVADGAAAATWLLARVEGRPGPCRALSDAEQRRVAAVAAGARTRIEQALGLGERTAPIPARRCPRCGEQQLVMRHGGERTPEVECLTCPGRWTGGAMEVLLRGAA